MSNVLYPNKQEFDELIKNEKSISRFFCNMVWTM